jgi:hypothetical protein
MDTDSVVFKHSPGQWSPPLSNYLGEWTNEIAPGSRILKFITCGPKNYCYITKDMQTGALNSVMKVKGLRLSQQATDLLTPEVMLDQVSLFASKRKSEEKDQPAAKKRCLVSAQRKVQVMQNKQLNEVYLKNGAAACMDVEGEKTVSGPCNCQACASKNSITIPQVRFRKHRGGGYVETSDIHKEYQLVLNKRWLFREFNGLCMPTDYYTYPFGFKRSSV